MSDREIKLIASERQRRTAFLGKEPIIVPIQKFANRALGAFDLSNIIQLKVLVQFASPLSLAPSL